MNPSSVQICIHREMQAQIRVFCMKNSTSPPQAAQHNQAALHLESPVICMRGSKPARQENADFLEWWHLAEGVFTEQMISIVEEAGREFGIQLLPPVADGCAVTAGIKKKVWTISPLGIHKAMGWGLQHRISKEFSN